MKAVSRPSISRLQLVLALFSFTLVSIPLWFINRWWLTLPLIPLMLLGYHFRQVPSTSWRAAWVGLVMAVILVSGLHCVQVMRSNIAQPPEWDFLAFWLDGRVAALGLNYYQPEHYQRLALTLDPSEEFTREVLDVGFQYPPPTMLLFLPLGWFDTHTAYMLWYAMNGAILIADILLLWRIFLGKHGLKGLALTTALVLMLQSVLQTVYYGQTTFMVLLVLLLFWRDRECWRGGIWLGLGILIKPFMAFILIYMLLRRRWSVMVGTLIVLTIVSLVTIVVFGPTTFTSYFRANPTAKLPDYLYTEMVNQSLLATILRLTEYDFSSKLPFTHPIFITLALFLGGITGWLVYHLDASHTDWALTLLMLMALLLYPATLTHYSVLLILPVLLLWMHRRMFYGGLWGVTVFIVLAYAFVGYRNGSYVFVGIALGWLVLAGIGFWLLMRQARLPDPIQVSSSPS